DRVRVYNNFITCIPNASVTSYGLHLVSTPYANVYHNSIHMVNAYTTATYGIYDQSGTNNTYRNNIIRSGGVGGSTDYMVVTTGTGTGSSFDYNSYIWNSNSPNIASINSTVYTVSNSINYLASGVGGVNSISVDPQFTSDTNHRHSSILV